MNLEDSKFNYKINFLMEFSKNKTLTIITHRVMIYFNSLQLRAIVIKIFKIW